MQLLKFAVVGGSGAIASLGLMYLLSTICRIHYSYSYAITFVIIVCFNYILNKHWTFKSLESRGLLLFGLGRLGTLAINEVLLWGLIEKLYLHYLAATAIAIFISSIFNFGFSRRYIWTKSKVT